MRLITWRALSGSPYFSEVRSGGCCIARQRHPIQRFASSSLVLNGILSMTRHFSEIGHGLCCIARHLIQRFASSSLE